MSNAGFHDEFEFLNRSSAEKRVKAQKNALNLLFEKYTNGNNPGAALSGDGIYQKLRPLLSEATTIFSLSQVQKEIYHSDTGTAVVPEQLKKRLLNIRCRFVVRPGTLQDLKEFVAFAFNEKIHYTVRAAGSWPFGGSIPLNNEIVLDLSYLDFYELDQEKQRITIGPGVLFADMRRYLKKNGFALRQEITNPNSGTICGWVVTGGLGIGAYKYGRVQNSVEAIFFLLPNGEWKILSPEDVLFSQVFDSEGQVGIVAGVVLKIKRESHISKPYAFSFPGAEDTRKFVQLLREWKLTPTSIIYFDKNYIRTTYKIQKDKNREEQEKALEAQDDLLMARVRRDMEVTEQMRELEHVVVMEFDSHEDYQKCLKHSVFNSPEGENRYREIVYRRLAVNLAHKLWKHRYAPVEMKSRGPSMLVSETILPLDKFPDYMAFVQSAVSNWINNPVKTEGHFLNSGEILIQSIILADTGTTRHKLYLALVPFMTQTSIFFGGKPYGSGIWNLPFLKALSQNGQAKRIADLSELKKYTDPQGLINQCKFINPVGRKLALRLFKKASSPLIEPGIKLMEKGLRKRKSKNGGILPSPGLLLWKANKIIFPTVVPPQIKSERPELLRINSVCAECDSCERVCPTSDVFGLLGIATPITRRKTANRLASGKRISQEEALGFLVCTRCDNCTRVCPTDIPLTDMFDMVEKNPAFQSALGLNKEEKKEFVDRMWEVMKESPLYREHTLAEQKEERSHLEHGLNIKYTRGYAYSKLFIDPETCIHCGMCAHENACIYGARRGNPRQIPELIDENCALCNACINFCPQNKAVQMERDFVQGLIKNAVDLEEKRYWETEKQFLRDTTTIQRSPLLTDMADIYLTEEILMEIDKEASTGQIPVSGMGQGDRHTGIGFDAERFSHFHIVGPAQNRLHEGDPDEELSVELGKRHRYCKFDAMEELHNPTFRKIKLMSPILYNAVPLESNGRLEMAFIKVAEMQKTLAVIDLNRILEYYEFFISEGNYEHLPAVIVPRVDLEIIDNLRVNPNVNRELLLDLWGMPMFEIVPHDDMKRTVAFIKESAESLYPGLPGPLLCGYLEVSEYDIVAGELLPHLRERIENYMELKLDVIHIHGLRNQDQYFVTSLAVRAIHHYLLSSGRRHKISLIASGGIRLASDSQKTIQRGAEATLLDFAAMLALDPYAYKANLEKKTTTDKLMNLDIEWAVKRLKNQMESRKVQILEVLGASGFKDIKKTVGEEGRLIDFLELEERLQKNVLEKEEKIAASERLNRELIREEPLSPNASPTYGELKKQVKPLKSPHYFYELGGVNQTVYQRDHVWPGNLIQVMGRMAAGDEQMFYLKNVRGTGLLGDGFDVMKILYQRDPDIIPDGELNKISTALPLDKDLVLRAPWMFGGKSVGSIGLDTWRAHVIAVRELGIQYDTGEGGYPTSFFLNRKGEPIFFTEPDIQLIKSFFQHDHHYTAKEIKSILTENGITAEEHSHIFEILNSYPELQPFLFYEVVSEEDEPFVSTELKTGLFGVTKENIKKARRVVIAYSQGAKMGIGGHILAGKVNRLVSYLRGIQGLEKLETDKLRRLIERIERIEKNAGHPLNEAAKTAYPHLLKSHDDKEIYPELKQQLWIIQQKAYELNTQHRLDPIEFEQVLRLCEEIISYSYTSVISPFPFHNCYSIEDVKAFIDMVRMINPGAVVSVKVSPSVDIEFIAAGLARIAQDNTEEVLKHSAKRKTQNAGGETLGAIPEGRDALCDELAAYARKYGMKIEVWLDGPRGGTGASPNIIKGQMGMHIEYAIPLIHDRLVRDGLRNYVKFIVSGGIRTYEDVIKAIALGADGIIWGTAPLVAVGCDRNRNCHDGCSRGIATSNLIMQNLRDVEVNSRQMINAFVIMQMQVIRSLAGLGLKDVRELRGRFDKIQWIGLKERVDFRIRQRREHSRHRDAMLKPQEARPVGQTNCGVAAIIGTHNIPSHILDETLYAMKNRGMDGVGVGKTLCFPDHPHHYAFSIMVKGKLQLEVEEELRCKTSIPACRREARQKLLEYRCRLAEKIREVFLDPYFEFFGETDIQAVRENYKTDANGQERDYREFGNPNTDPGDMFRFFVRVKEPVLHQFIEEKLLIAPRFIYIREYFPGINLANYKEDSKFLQKAEDLFVFNHSIILTQVLYTYDALPEDWENFVQSQKASDGRFAILTREDALSDAHLELHGQTYLEFLLSYARNFHYTEFEEKYHPRARKIAAVMSCGKNFAVWKTAGREIPWETPASPNNIIHVRLATGSAVEQMNAHPFGKLHTALTHNGETTNYETLKQRVEQFGLPPLATTDTEVASLKFHLLAEELEYPDWALFESFSPTTGDDLALIPPELRGQLEEVQRVEFTSSPDGPYQYLCLRHQPDKRITERVDLKDPADLRPSTTAFWYAKEAEKKRAFSIIASEEQAIQKVLDLLDKDGLIDGAAADRVLVSNGMISRFEYDEQGDIHDFHILDRYGREISLDNPGEHYSFRRSELQTPANAADLERQLTDNAARLKEWIRENLPGWDFNTFRWTLNRISDLGFGIADLKSEKRRAKSEKRNSNPRLDTPQYSIFNIQYSIDLLTYFIDYLRTMDTGEKATGSLIDITRSILYDLFDRLPEAGYKEGVNSAADSADKPARFMPHAPEFILSLSKGPMPRWVKAGFKNSDISEPLSADSQTLLIDVSGFEPEGIDPKLSLAAFLAKAYDLGWRKFVLYRVNGQRLISTAVMGKDNTDDVEMDVYGTPGEYFGAFMQGGTIRCHGNAQNFCAMGMHHGNLYVFGNAGKVCGYASKGGAVYILGDVVDRGWTNSVNDPRCQDLQIHILGSASKYCGESLMGGDFFFGGLFFDSKGKLRLQERPYRGTKLLGGASRGNMLFFDPENRLDPHQYTHGKFAELNSENWPYWKERVETTLRLAGVEILGQNGSSSFVADGKEFKIVPENFRLIIPKGGLKGYESH